VVLHGVYVFKGFLALLLTSHFLKSLRCWGHRQAMPVTCIEKKIGERKMIHLIYLSSIGAGFIAVFLIETGVKKTSKTSSMVTWWSFGCALAWLVSTCFLHSFSQDRKMDVRWTYIVAS
jgi:hypothetical protein